jgi:succinate dehydrogenase flavin-adding protein (antitoxin of CptAB toxin-antitoxin module)
MSKKKFTVRLEETKILFLYDISNFTSFLDFSDQDLQIWMLGKRPNCDGCEGSVQHVSESPFSFSTFDFWRD